MKDELESRNGHARVPVSIDTMEGRHRGGFHFSWPPSRNSVVSTLVVAVVGVGTAACSIIAPEVGSIINSTSNSTSRPFTDHMHIPGITSGYFAENRRP